MTRYNIGRYLNFQKIFNVCEQVSTTFSNYIKKILYNTSSKIYDIWIYLCMWTQKAEGQNFVKNIFYVINEKNLFSY